MTVKRRWMRSVIATSLRASTRVSRVKRDAGLATELMAKAMQERRSAVRLH